MWRRGREVFALTRRVYVGRYGLLRVFLPGAVGRRFGSLPFATALSRTGKPVERDEVIADHHVDAGEDQRGNDRGGNEFAQEMGLHRRTFGMAGSRLVVF